MSAGQDNHAPATPPPGGHPTGHPAGQPGLQPPGPSRRQMLRGAGAGLGVAALAPVLGLGGRPTGADRARLTARAAGSRVTDFGQGWKFALVNPYGITDPGGTYANAQDPGFDDSGWRQLDVPHDWSIELAPVDNASTSSATGFLPGGLAWYRKHVTLPKSLAGQRISIEFDGVYRNSDVYLNGKLLGNHPYAYTGFSYDLTGLVHTDGVTEDVIAVSCADQQPSSRWYSGDGIFRNVYLVTTGPVHVARHGTFVTTPGLPGTLGSGYATVQVDTDVQNDGPAAAPVQVAVTLTGPDGKAAGRGAATVSVPAGQARTATVSVKVANPQLWSTDRPHLYTAQTSLSVGGTAADSVSTPFGIRYATFDPAAGFSLNGRYMKIQGVDLHATEGAVGSAVRYDALVRQMRLMKSMGVNFLRTAHNPPAPELIAVCEQLGILMMVEAFDCWHTGKLPYDYHLYFDQWGDSDIKEMVNAAKNSPAVALWSIGNETPDTGSSRGPGIARQLVADIKSIDTTQARGDGLGQVPQRARHRLAPGPHPGRAGRPRGQLQHGHVHGRPARQVPGHVLLLLRDGLGDLQPRRVPGPAAAEHGGELHPGQAGHLLLRQQPRLLDDERGVRAEEGPGPQVLERGLPVVRAGLHRRADPLRRVPGQGVVLRRDGHGGLREGRLPPVPQPVDGRPDGAHRADGLDQPLTWPAHFRLGLRQRGHG